MSYFFWLHSILVCIDGLVQSKSGNSVLILTSFFPSFYVLKNRETMVIIFVITKSISLKVL